MLRKVFLRKKLLTSCCESRVKLAVRTFWEYRIRWELKFQNFAKHVIKINPEGEKSVPELCQKDDFGKFLKIKLQDLCIYNTSRKKTQLNAFLNHLIDDKFG